MEVVIKVTNVLVKFPRGRQRSFTSFSALLCAQSFPVQHWDTATVDQILIQGDRMYLNALESQRIPDTDTLSLIYLPNQARSTVQLPAIEVTDQNQSPIEVTKARFHYKQDSITTHLALFYHTLFLYCYSCFKNVSSVYECSQHYPLKENIDLTVITFSMHFHFYFKMKGCLLFPNVSGIYIFKGEESSQYDYICSHCVSKNSLSIWRTLIPHFLSVTLLLHD